VSDPLAEEVSEVVLVQVAWCTAGAVLHRPTRAELVPRPQHFLYFLPLPHGHWSFRPVILAAARWSRSRAHCITLAGGRACRSSDAMNCMYGSMWRKNAL